MATLRRTTPIKAGTMMLGSRSRWAVAMLMAQVVISLSSVVQHSGDPAWQLLLIDIVWGAMLTAHAVLLRLARTRDAIVMALLVTGAKSALSVLVAPGLFPIIILLPALSAGYALLQPNVLRMRVLALLTGLSYLTVFLAYRVAHPGGGAPRAIIDLLLLTAIMAGSLTFFQTLVRYGESCDSARLRTERANAMLTSTREQLTHLLDVSRAISQQTALKDLMNVVLEQLMRTVASDTAALYLVDADLRVTDTRTHGMPAPWPEQPLELRRPPIHHLRVLQTGMPVLVADVSGATSEARLVRAGLELGADDAAPRVASWLGVPLNTQGRTIGLLVLASGQRFFFRAHHAQLALAFANQVAALIESARIKEHAVRAAAMTERARLSRELHDSVSQALFGVSLGVRTGLELLPLGADAAQKPIAYALELAEAALLEMRALIFELRPESLREEGLVKALRRQAEAVIARYKAEYGSKLKLSLCEAEPHISLDAKEALYRISMEALTNAAKHARATLIELDLTCNDNWVTLLIVDNGKGFDPKSSFPGHLGLITMRERAEQFGGSIDIDSAIGHGTRIAVRLPLSAEYSAERVATG